MLDSPEAPNVKSRSNRYSSRGAIYITSDLSMDTIAQPTLRSCSASIITIDGHIFLEPCQRTHHMERCKRGTTYMTKVTGPISGIFIAHPKLNQNFQVFALQDILRPVFIHLFRLSIGQKREGWGAVGRDKRDRHRLRIDRL